MSYGGISGIVLMFVMMPLGLEILKECNVPRYMAPGILLGSMAPAALCMPGSPLWHTPPKRRLAKVMYLSFWIRKMLRRSLAEYRKFIVTHRGVGYKFEAD